MIKLLSDKQQFRLEFFLALAITGIACCAGFSNLLFVSNDFYPVTADAMGHMAKVRFLAESFSRGEFPSWFPYWYNGSTVAQYYPPLAYWLMAPIYLFNHNVMLTFKIYCFIMIFIGGIGVWFFCRRFIGPWCSLFGSVAFCLQPYILLSFLSAGLVAQGPIIAFTPWYLIAFLAYSKRHTRWRFLICTTLCSLMILSHPMTIFMICLCIMIVFFVFLLIKKISYKSYFLSWLSIIFAGILTGFWSIVGVTGLENPGIPYLLGEAVMQYTADVSWFLTLSSGFFFYAIPISLSSIAALLLYLYFNSKNRLSNNENYYVLFCIILTLFTTIFSFGLRLPLFKYIPMAESLVPGRILSLTSVSAGILCAYLLYGIQSLSQNRGVELKIFTSLVSLTVMILVLVNMNPFRAEYRILRDIKFNQMISSIELEGKNFEKGRYSYIGPYDSSETYFPLSYDFNICEGWNIEGTPHNIALWNQSIAYSTDNLDSIAKELAFWNVRSLFVVEKFDKVIDELGKRYSFEVKATRDGNNFYASNTPSSYFLTDKRNSLILGLGSIAVPIEFPYLVEGSSDRISDYSLEELEKYKLVYLCEPSVETIQEQKSIENAVTHLISRGVTVVIEPAASRSFSLFDVAASDVFLEDNPTLQRQNQSPIKSSIDKILIDKKFGYSRVLFGLDKEYYNLVQNEGRLQNGIIGAKRVGNGQVVFLGMHLSQFLKPVYARNWGVPQNNEYPECTAEVTSLFEDIFRTYGVNTNFWPDPFPIKNANWNYKGVDFAYSSRAAQEMTLSVTYTPRWKATLDGNLLEIGQKENLITLYLPAGEHNVSLRYGMTIFGVIGYSISVLGLILLFVFIKYYDIILYRFSRLCDSFSKYLQF